MLVAVFFAETNQSYDFKLDGGVPIEQLVEEMGKFLTRREVKVVKLLLAGKNNVEIAGKMKVTRMRIGQMTKHIFEKIRRSKIGKKLKGILS
jgi:transcriptional regulator